MHHYLYESRFFTLGTLEKFLFYFSHPSPSFGVAEEQRKDGSGRFPPEGRLPGGTEAAADPTVLAGAGGMARGGP